MAIKYCTFTVLMLNVAISVAQPVVPVTPISLDSYQVIPLDYPEAIETSGLTLKGGRLYTVSDKHKVIFEIVIDENEALLKPIISLHSERDLAVSVLDLEGITVFNGDFVLVSESHHRLIHVDAQQKMHWMPDDNTLYTSAHKSGLLALENAGLEGLAYFGDNRFIVAAERQPRGIIEVTFNAGLTHITEQKNQLLAKSRQNLSNRHADLTALFVHQDQIYGLQRNAYVIHELNKATDGLYYEGKSWSYEAIVRHPDYVYASMQYGHAEGLAMDDDYFYLVVDNNGIGNAKNPNDQRPLLIIAKRP